MRKIKIIMHISIILSISITGLGCEKIKSKEAKVDTLLASWATDDQPGLAVSIIEDGTPVYQKGFGIANLEYDIPITNSTVFHIASVSKQFTVFSILLLEKEGKLSLDDDIRKYIPEIHDFSEIITIRHLAAHTSGLRDYNSLLLLSGWRFDDVITQNQILNLVYKQKELNSKPGTEFLYSNTGYVLLAEIVSRVSGQEFTDYTMQNIFKPLGMKNTFFYDNHEGIVKNRAYSYRPGYYNNFFYKKMRLNYSYVGSTSLFSTIEDLSLWAMNFSTLKVGDIDLINTMNKPAILNNGESSYFALGQFKSKYKGLNTIQHSGGDAGYRSFLIRFPDNDLSIIVLSNLNTVNPREIAYDIADIYLKKEFIFEKKNKEEFNEIEVSRDILNSYVGEYEVESGSTINISKYKNSISAKFKYSPLHIFKPLSENEFINSDINMKIEFLNDGSENINVTNNGTTKICPKLEPYKKSSINKTEYIGKYYSDELETNYKIVLDNDKLILKHYKVEDKELEILYKDTFLLTPDSRFVLKIIRDENNNITGFDITTLRSRNIWFKKVNSVQEI